MIKHEFSAYPRDVAIVEGVSTMSPRKRSEIAGEPRGQDYCKLPTNRNWINKVGEPHTPLVASANER